ncbi:helix-hairpin-helix domain-containing protein [Tessaracoccus sp.]
MTPGTRSTTDGELVRARLAFISAGQPPLGAPRRAVPDTVDDAPLEGAPIRQPHVPNEATGDPSGLHILDRFSVTPRQAVAVLALLLCGVVVALTAMGRSSASQVPTVAVPVVSESASSMAPVPSASAPARVRIHVLGAVVTPGVVTVDSDAIVQDVVLAAGGLRPDADPAELNLAAPVSDGQQVIVGTKTEPRGQVNQQPPPTGSSGTNAQVNLNTATQSELEALPGVGPVLAGAILGWRQEHGAFRSVAELQEVTGIGPKIYAELEPLVMT